MCRGVESGREEEIRRVLVWREGWLQGGVDDAGTDIGGCALHGCTD